MVTFACVGICLTIKWKSLEQVAVAEHEKEWKNVKYGWKCKRKKKLYYSAVKILDFSYDIFKIIDFTYDFCHAEVSLRGAGPGGHYTKVSLSQVLPLLLAGMTQWRELSEQQVASTLMLRGNKILPKSKNIVHILFLTMLVSYFRFIGKTLPELSLAQNESNNSEHA